MIRKNFMICLFLVSLFFLSSGISNVFISNALAQEKGKETRESVVVRMVIDADGTVEFLGYKDRIELKPGEHYKPTKPIKGSNSIRVVISNPYCFEVAGKVYCF